MPTFELKEIRSYDYDRPAIERGYAGQTLSIDLADNGVGIDPVTEQMKEVFVGGKGFDLYMMWNAVKGDTKWDDPDNPICIASGPTGGSPVYPGSGKSIVTAISPLTNIVVDSNVGGYFGPYLKFAGFDAMAVSGKAEQDVVIYIDGIDEKIQIFEISGELEDSYAISQELTDYFGQGKPVTISVVSTGQGSKHSRFGCLNFTWYDLPRKMPRYKQAGRGGIGTVFADKRIKAIVARWGRIPISINGPADLGKFKTVALKHSKEIVELDPKQNEMAVVGTAHLVPIMNDHDCLPVNNFRFGQHPQAELIGREAFRHLFDPGFDGCWKGCTVSCAHGVQGFTPLTGPYGGQTVFVDGPEYETIAGCGSNLGIFDPFTILELNFYCDAYGLDTISASTSIAFAMECYEAGLIDKTHTGGMELNFGQRYAALELLHQMARGEGFGNIVGQGVRQMKAIFAEKYGIELGFLNDIGMESKGLEFSIYMTKESLAQQGGYGLALKGAQHDESWLIFLDMVHNFMPSFEDKAEALHWFPMFRTWFAITGLCKLPWNDIVPEDNKDTLEPAKVMKHVEWYAKYFSSVTGRESSPDDLITMSESVYNFQRIFNLKMGSGRRQHDTVPYRAVGPVTEEEYQSRRERYDGQLREQVGFETEGASTAAKIAALRQYREERYENLKDAVYARRGWTADGIPTIATAQRLGIDFPDVIELLNEHGVTA